MPRIEKTGPMRVAMIAAAAIAGLAGATQMLPGRGDADHDPAIQAGFLQGGTVTVRPLPGESAAGTAVLATGPAPAPLPDDPAMPRLRAPRIAMRDAGPGPAPRAPGPQVTRLTVAPAVQGLALTAPAPAAPSVAPAGPDAGCISDLQAMLLPGGLARVAVSAPCHVGRAVTFGHAGLAVDLTIPESGRVTATLPVLDHRRPFTAKLAGERTLQAMPGGASAVAVDHVVLQWRGDAGLQLHALEFGAGYGDPGHIWAGNRQGPVRAIRGEGGFLIRLGDPAAGGVAEVYSFPAAAMREEGAVEISVEAVVTGENCGRDVSGQILRPGIGGGIVTAEVSFAMPECDALGDILVLKNVAPGLKIAAN